MGGPADARNAFQLLGSGICAAVTQRLLLALLKAAGYPQGSLGDPWGTGTAQARLRAAPRWAAPARVAPIRAALGKRKRPQHFSIDAGDSDDDTSVQQPRP